MPINLDPDPSGNVVIIGGLARVLGVPDLMARSGPGGLFMPHHATCTARPRTRRPRNPSRETT